jgi:hypothetical protein
MDPVKFLARTLTACAILVTTMPAVAQTAPTQIKVTAADKAAAASATHHAISAMAKRTLPPGMGKIRTDSGESGHGGLRAAGTNTRGPGDLTFNGGHTVSATQHHAIYLFPGGSVCTSPACWGNVEQFLGDLGRSNFIHVTDQYVGSEADNRYRVGTSLAFSYLLPAHPLIDTNMQEVAHAAAVALGGASGYGHMYHIFLAPEQNECIDASFTICSSNYFCAYHSSVFFSDIGEIVYSVEPYNVNVFGCNVPATSPNGGFDDTYDVLSHETFEAITDPDLDAWWNSTNASMFGQEIGDECVFLLFDSLGNYVSSDPGLETLNGRRYALQLEYNNSERACTSRP